MPSDAADYLTVPDVARMLRCRTAAVVTWIRQGRLRAVDLSDGLRPRYRIRRADLEQFLERRAVVPRMRPARRVTLLTERYV